MGQQSLCHYPITADFLVLIHRSYFTTDIANHCGSMLESHDRRVWRSCGLQCVGTHTSRRSRSWNCGLVSLYYPWFVLCCVMFFFLILLPLPLHEWDLQLFSYIFLITNSYVSKSGIKWCLALSWHPFATHSPEYHHLLVWTVISLHTVVVFALWSEAFWQRHMDMMQQQQFCFSHC